MREQIIGYLGGEDRLNPLIIDLIDSSIKATSHIDLLISQLNKWQLIGFTFAVTYVFLELRHFLGDLDTSLFGYVKKRFFRVCKKIPFFNRHIRKEIEKTRASLEGEILKSNKGTLFVQSLPPKGFSQSQVLDKIKSDYLKLNELPWEDGAVSGCVYGADKHLTELTTKVFQL